MSDTKSASSYKPTIEVGTVIHLPHLKRYKRWDGERWVDVTEEVKLKQGDKNEQAKKRIETEV